MALIIFLTFDRSLSDWKKDGTLKRELEYYSYLSKKIQQKITFFSYGTIEDQELVLNYKDLSVINIYRKRPNNNFLRLFYPTYYLLKNYKTLKSFNYIKTNQNLGSWNAILCKIINRKAKLISRCGFDLFHFSLESKKNRIISYIICFLIYHFSNKIILPTNFYKEFVKKNFFISDKKISVIANFVNLNHFKPYQKKKFNKKILFVGRLAPQKNLFELIEYFSNSKFEINLYGEGELKSDLISFAEASNTKIRIFDKIPNSELPNIYNRYKYFALFSLYEGNPKTLLEALSCGLLCVVKNSVGIRSIIQHNYNGIIINEELKPHIFKKLENKNFLNNTIQNGLKYIKDNNSMDIVLQKESIIYD